MPWLAAFGFLLLRFIISYPEFSSSGVSHTLSIKTGCPSHVPASIKSGDSSGAHVENLSNPGNNQLGLLRFSREYATHPGSGTLLTVHTGKESATHPSSDMLLTIHSGEGSAVQPNIGKRYALWRRSGCGQGIIRPHLRASVCVWRLCDTLWLVSYTRA